MGNSQPDPRNAAVWQENLRRNGLLKPEERVLAVLEQDSPPGALRGVALTDSRLFSFADRQITRQVAFRQVDRAECKVRLRRSTRYEFHTRDGSTTSILLSGSPESVDDFCRVLDAVCVDRFPGFVPKEPAAEEPVPEASVRRKIPVETRSQAPPRKVFTPGPASAYERVSFSTSSPNRYSIAGLLLSLFGLLPGYGVGLTAAALATLAYAWTRKRDRESEWDPPLRVLTLVLCILGLGSFFLYRLALRFPDSLGYASLAYDFRPPQLLVASWVGRAVVAVVVLLFSVSFHEAAHALIAYWNGDPTSAKLGRITLNPIAHLDLFGSILLPIFLAWSSSGTFFFAYARPVPVNPNRYRNLRLGYVTVSLAGPGTNFLLALLAIWLQFFLACVLVVVHGLSGTSLVAHPVVGTAFFLLWLLVFLNIFLGCFNLLPIPPLDGYHVLQGSLPWRWTEFLRPIERYGFFILLILLMSGGLGGFFNVVEHFSGYGEAFRELLYAGPPPG